MYKDKIYAMHTPGYGEVYDDFNNAWDSWVSPLVNQGDWSCMVTWRDTFILIGGSGNPRGVQMYNHTTKAWSILNNMPPINRVGHSCEQMPNNPDKFMEKISKL